MMKTFVSAIAIFLLIWNQAFVESLKLLEMRVPARVAEGSDVLLVCQYDMQGDPLYTVKWFRDNEEFYRYSPNSNPSKMYFHTTGVLVDASRTSSDRVTLKNVTKKSAGKYQCEVSSDAPTFYTVVGEKYMEVY